MELPHFKYHPDPVGTGSIIQSDSTCIVCGTARGFIYSGPAFCEEELDDCICPWCIADGSAHEKFDAEFTDASTVGEYGDGPKVPEGVVEEVAYRTPGFSGWQQVYWCRHCGDASMFLGVVGRRELMERGREAIEAIKDDVGLDGEGWESFFTLIDKDGSPTAYLFQCRHCGAFCGYTDTD